MLVNAQQQPLRQEEAARLTHVLPTTPPVPALFVHRHIYSTTVVFQQPIQTLPVCYPAQLIQSRLDYIVCLAPFSALTASLLRHAPTVLPPPTFILEFACIPAQPAHMHTIQFARTAHWLTVPNVCCRIGPRHAQAVIPTRAHF